MSEQPVHARKHDRPRLLTQASPGRPHRGLRPRRTGPPLTPDERKVLAGLDRAGK